MKKTMLVVLAVLLMTGAGVFAQDVLIDSDGNVTTGSSNTDANLEVTGSTGEHGIVGSAQGGNAAGVYGDHASGNYGILGYETYGVYGNSISDWAGYFDGKVNITGDLTVGGQFNYDHVHSGADITSGAVGEGFIDPLIARDSELTWGNLDGIPAGFADGVDNDTDTTYTAGTGLDLTGTTFSVEVPLSLSGSDAETIIHVFNSGDGSGVLASALQYGGNFTAYASGGTAVYGLSNSTNSGYGGFFQALGTYGKGVQGVAQDSGDGTNYGGYFTAGGKTGYGVYSIATNIGDGTNYGGWFRADGVTGRGVYGEASDSGEVENYGGYFKANGRLGRGVYGEASYNGSGESFGGYFESKSIEGTGVYGEGNVGGSFKSVAFNGIGVHGEATYSTAYAGYFEGRGYFSGNVGFGTTNPENKLHVYDATSTYNDPVAIFESDSLTRISVMGPGSDGDPDTVQSIGYQFADPNDPFKGGFMLDEDSNDLEFYTDADGSNPRMVIADNGQVRVGSSSDTSVQMTVSESNAFDASTLNAAFQATSTHNHAVFAKSTANSDVFIDTTQHAVHAWSTHSLAVYAHTGVGSAQYPPGNRTAAVYALNDRENGEGVHIKSDNGYGLIVEKGYVGINKTDPTTHLDINGHILASGNITGGLFRAPTMPAGSGQTVIWDGLNFKRESSSERYKQNIRPFDEDFRKILSLEARQYQMKEDFGDPDTLLFGYIAEELDEAGLNNLVHYDAEGRPDGVKYSKVAIYLAEVVKEQDRELSDLKKEIAGLTETVRNLQRMVKLQSGMAMK